MADKLCCNSYQLVVGLHNVSKAAALKLSEQIEWTLMTDPDFADTRATVTTAHVKQVRADVETAGHRPQLVKSRV